jgi:hypothetical protein
MGGTVFTITSTRIVGLVAIVCAVVAPQALAAPSDQQQQEYLAAVAAGSDLSGFDVKAANRVTPPDAAMAYDLIGLDLRVLNNIPGYQQQEAYLKFLARASAETRRSVDAATKAAAIKALRRRSVALEAAYRKLHPDAYRPAVQKSDKAAVWSFPASCNGQAQAESDHVSSGC